MRQNTMKRANVVVASIAVWLWATPSILGQADPSRTSVPLSDPSRPATIRVNLFQGAITVKASSGNEVVVVTSGERVRGGDQPPEASGLRRLSPPSGTHVEEENNVVSIGATRLTDVDVEVQVPARANLALRTMNGQVLVEGVDGDIEATSMNGTITLTGVGGAVVAHGMNGKVVAVLKQVAPQKPMAFTSMNGTVDVTLPAAVGANLKLRSDRGEIYTDFDVQLQQPPVANPPVPAPSPAPAPAVKNGRARSRAEVRLDTTIQGSVNGGGPEFELRTFNGNIYLRKGT
jgi:hypothetical protein